MKKSLLFFSLIAIALTSCDSVKPYDTPYEEFSFRLNWGVQLDSSYDSKTGKVVKTNKVIERKPEEYITTYQLPNLEEIYNKVKKMNPYSYARDFDPFATKHHIMSNPNIDYYLVIDDKIIEVQDFPIGVGTDDKTLSSKGKKFIELVYLIIDTVQASDEWKALPDYEVLYD